MVIVGNAEHSFSASQPEFGGESERKTSEIAQQTRFNQRQTYSTVTLPGSALFVLYQ